MSAGQCYGKCEIDARIRVDAPQAAEADGDVVIPHYQWHYKHELSLHRAQPPYLGLITVQVQMLSGESYKKLHYRVSTDQRERVLLA